MMFEKTLQWCQQRKHLRTKHRSYGLWIMVGFVDNNIYFTLIFCYSPPPPNISVCVIYVDTAVDNITEYAKFLAVMYIPVYPTFISMWQDLYSSS